MERLQESPVVLLRQELAKIASYIEPESKLVDSASDGSMEKKRWKMTAYSTLHIVLHIVRTLILHIVLHIVCTLIP